MNLLIALTVACICPTPRMINISGYKWDARDAEVTAEAVRHCKSTYPSNPCVKSFTKKDEHDYRVICGGCK